MGSLSVVQVAPKYLTGLIALIKTNLGNMEAGEAGADGNSAEKAEQVNTFYNNTLNHIKLKKKNANGLAYGDIDL